MCGVPHHAAENYIAKLIKQGRRVAIGEQTSEPVPGKIVDREISQIISAGTIDNLSLLDDRRHNYLAAIYQHKTVFGIAVVDHSTGEFTLAEFPDRQQLEDELTRLSPSELLILMSSSNLLVVSGTVFHMTVMRSFSIRLFIPSVTTSRSSLWTGLDVLECTLP